MSRSTSQLILNRAARIKSAAGEFTRLKTAKQEWMRPGDGLVPNQVTNGGVGITHNGTPVTYVSGVDQVTNNGDIVTHNGDPVTIAA